jgi:hypothetical protein
MKTTMESLLNALSIALEVEPATDVKRALFDGLFQSNFAVTKTKVSLMLELRPTCENCNKVLASNSLEARICTYECTFCAACVDNVLENVCPNCGGGFVPRPIRPSRNWKGDNFLGKDPASTKVRHRPVDSGVHARFASAIKVIPPHMR